MKTARLSVPKAVYTEAGLRMAALVFAKRAAICIEKSAGGWVLDLPEAMAGDFLNELLNQEYRFLVADLNGNAASLQATQALFAARGGENPPPAPAEDAAFKKKAAALLMAARR